MHSRKHSSPGRAGFLLIRSREAYLPNSQRCLTPGPVYQTKLITLEASLKRGGRRRKVGAPTACHAAPRSAHPHRRVPSRVVAGGTTLPVKSPPVPKCPRVSRQGRKGTERKDALKYCTAVTRLCGLLCVRPHHVGLRSLGVFSA